MRTQQHELLDVGKQGIDLDREQRDAVRERELLPPCQLGQLLYERQCTARVFPQRSNQRIKRLGLRRGHGC